MITGQGNWPKHVASFTCRLPKAFIPEVVAIGPLDTTLTNGLALTRDGTTRVVPVPGHTPGHGGGR